MNQLGSFWSSMLEFGAKVLVKNKTGTEVVKCLPSMHEALGSIYSTEEGGGGK
jgi:hypothetical protein